jgi:hypothetical protein
MNIRPRKSDHGSGRLLNHDLPLRLRHNLPGAAVEVVVEGVIRITTHAEVIPEAAVHRIH